MFKSITYFRWTIKIISILIIGNSIQCKRSNNQSIGSSASSVDNIHAIASKKLVVILHGSDSNGSFWQASDFLKSMQTLLPDCCFITPNGGEKSDIKPNGWKWFSIEDFLDYKNSMVYGNIGATSPLMKEIQNLLNKKFMQQIPTGIVNNQIAQKINNNLSLSMKEIGILRQAARKHVNQAALLDLTCEEVAKKHQLSIDELNERIQAAIKAMQAQLSPAEIHKKMEQFSREGIINDKQVNHLTAIIQQKQADLNLTNKDTIIIGFSQGAIMGLYVTLIQKEPFLCTIGLSGALIPPMKNPINTQTPICFIHGEQDMDVPVQFLDAAVQYCATHDIPCNSHKLIEDDHRSFILYKDKNKKFSEGVKLTAQFIEKYIQKGVDT